jgi:hypothetical protein
VQRHRNGLDAPAAQVRVENGDIAIAIAEHCERVID